MKKLFVVAVAVVFALSAFAQNPPPQEGKKDDKAPTQKKVVIVKRGGEDGETLVIKTLGKDGEEVTKEIRKVVIGSDKPRLGLSLSLKKSGDETPEGPTVSGVSKGSGAEEAGFRKGDVILKMDGKPLLIKESKEKKEGHVCERLDMTIPDFKEGQQVLVEFKRGEEVKQVTVTAKKLDEEMVWLQCGDDEKIEKLIRMKKLQTQDEKPRLGMALLLKSENGETARGPVVAGVSEGSGAEEAGIRKGDVVLSMDGKPLLSGEGDELDMNIPDFSDGQKVLVRYERDGDVQEATVTAKKLEGGDIPLEWIDENGEGVVIRKGPDGKTIKVIVETDDEEEEAE